MAVDRQTVEAILKAIPQQSPFRFIDDVVSLDEHSVVGTYRFREDEYFYRGHFPGRPVTPGVILIETMAQTAVGALGLYLLMKDGAMTMDTLNNHINLFTYVEHVEFTGIVRPGERVIIRGEKVYFRRNSMKVRVSMERENGEVVCSGVIAGMAVKLEERGSTTI
jgi:3-hydroxyacyl-[acyl-carrier-protein] dehydratase